MAINSGNSWGLRDTGLTIAKFLPLAVIVHYTNPDALSQVPLLFSRMQLATLVPMFAIWAATILALFIAAFHRNWGVRLCWGALIATATAAAWGYRQISGSELNVFDMLSLWNERHEAGRAGSFYSHQIWLAMALFAFCIVIFMLPTPTLGSRLNALFKRLSVFPALPIIMIAVVFWSKNGSSYIPMPSQFSPLSLSALLAIKVTTQKVPERLAVNWQPLPVPNGGKPNNIILLVDESLRGDYVDLTPGNTSTPKLASLADKFVNFGPAVSGGDCSNYSNAILRFGVSRANIVTTANENATLFSYAKKAGFRTVFIDAQARNISDGNLLQNFMTLKEKADIDGFYGIRDIPSYEADAELARILALELKSDKPIFVYANKNGTHFPYDQAYPTSAAKYHPTMTEQGQDTQDSRINSYHNAIDWSVESFMVDLFAKADLSRTTMIYTADHGQKLQPAQLTHCQVENPDPRMGNVPLMVYTSDPSLRANFENGAALSKGKASHFQIAPTLYRLMGYAQADIAKTYDESLFDGTRRKTEFTSGDIFGLFSTHINETLLDLSKDYMEHPGEKSLAKVP